MGGFKIDLIDLGVKTVLHKSNKIRISLGDISGSDCGEY
jgi:hypothetical protein